MVEAGSIFAEDGSQDERLETFFRDAIRAALRNSLIPLCHTGNTAETIHLTI